MNYTVGQTGTLGGTTSCRVVIAKIEEHSYTPADIWFRYEAGETNRPLSHFQDTEMFPLPIGLVEIAFTPDEQPKDEFHVQLDAYISRRFPLQNQKEAQALFDRMERGMGRKYIIDEYFNKEK